MFSIWAFHFVHVTAPLVCWTCDFIDLIFCVCLHFPSSLPLFFTPLCHQLPSFSSPSLRSDFCLTNPCTVQLKNTCLLTGVEKIKQKKRGKRLQLQGGYCTFGLEEHWRSSWLHTGATFVWHQQIEALELDWTWTTRSARLLSHMGDLTSFKLAQMGRRANRRSNHSGPFMTSTFLPSVQLLHSI